MDIGDLLQTMAAIAVVALGLLGGRKKKPDPRRPAPRRPPTRAPQRPRPVSAGGGPDRLLDDLRRQLELASGRVVAEEPPEAYSLEVMPAEAQSLETLEAAGEASHQRFHEEYIRPLEEVRSIEQRAVRPAGGIRAAVIWAEILGPPKGLQP